MKRISILMFLTYVLGLVSGAFGALAPGWSESGAGSANYENGVWGLSITEMKEGGVEHFVYKPLKGDGSITARVRLLDASSIWGSPLPDISYPGIYVGILDDLGSYYSTRSALAGVDMDSHWHTLSTRWKVSPSDDPGYGYTIDNVSPISDTYYWVRLERMGDSFTGYASPNGTLGSWTVLGSSVISMNQDTFIGLCIDTAGSNIQLFKAEIDNVIVLEKGTAPITIPFELKGSVPEPGSVMSVINTGSGDAITGIASNTGDVINSGGFFVSDGQSGAGVSALSTGINGVGVMAIGSGEGGAGIYASGGFLAGFFDGPVKITDYLDVDGSIYQRGNRLHADYVFQPNYELESIEEHSQFMWQNGHLKAIPEAQVDDDGQEVVEVGAHQRSIVEELEKAHIYIEQLNKRIKTLEEKLAKLEARLGTEQQQ